jgi:pilus assembly protein CpaE
MMPAGKGITAVVACDASVPSVLVVDHIPRDAGIEVEEVVGTLYPPADVLKASDADVLVVACADGSTEALELVGWWHSSRPGRPAIVFCGASNNGFVEQAFAAGADDLIVLEPGPSVSDATIQHVAFALQKAVARTTGPVEHPMGVGKLICVLGPKGGIGKTITSCNLALALMKRSKRVVLVDLDLQFGDVALSLGMTPTTTSYDLAVSPGGLDAEKLDAFLMTHQTGLRVLAAPARPDQAHAVVSEFLSDVYELLRGKFDYVIVDTPPAFSPEVITSIDVSTYVCVVGMLDALSLKNTRLGIETLDLMGYEHDRIRIVLNRANTSVGITRNDVVSILGRNPDILVPSHRDVARSVNEGVPVVLSQKRSEASRAFEALAGLFVQQPVAAVGSRRGRSLIRKGRS